MMREFGKRSDHAVEKLKDGVFRIDEFGSDNCFLIVGEARALLIDTGTGYGDLRAVIERITDLPLTVAVTHAHTDHIGGKGQFEKVYVHRADVCRFCRISASRFMRKIFLSFQAEAKSKGIKRRDVVKPLFKTEWIPFDEGFEFDLGGKVIKTVHVPGHTLGSVAFIDESDKCVFVGDDIAPCLWLFLPHASTAEEWLPSAEKLIELGEKYDVYWGHGDGKLTLESMRKSLSLGRELTAERKNSLFPAIKAYPKLDFNSQSIIYKTNRVKSRKR